MVTMDDWVRHEVSEMELSTAKSRTAQWDLHMVQRSGAQHFDSKNRFVGHLGEFAFAHYLDYHGIDYEIDTYQDYGREFLYHPDFIASGKAIDVKTGYCKAGSLNALPPSYQFLIAEQQASHDVDYFVHVQTAPGCDYVYIIGYILRAEAIKHGLHSGGNLVNPCYGIPFSELKSIETLLDELKKEG